MRWRRKRDNLRLRAVHSVGWQKGKVENAAGVARRKRTERGRKKERREYVQKVEPHHRSYNRGRGRSQSRNQLRARVAHACAALKLSADVLTKGTDRADAAVSK